MGASVTKSSSEIIAEAIVNVAIKSSSESQQAVDQSIIVSNSYIGKGGEVLADSKIILQSLADFKITNETINDIMSELKQVADAESMAMTASVSQNESKIRQVLSSSLESVMVHRCAQIVKNTIEIRGSVVEGRVRSAVDITTKCLSKSITNNKDIKQVTADVDSKAKSVASLLSFGFGGTMVMLFIVIAIIVAIKYSSSSDNKSNVPPVFIKPMAMSNPSLCMSMLAASKIKN